jgi:hypothetical protein
MGSRQDHIIRRDEEGNELMLFLLPALHLLDTSNGRKKKPRHISSPTRKQLMQEILDEHEKDCRVAFCMEPNIFRDIASYLREENLLHDTRDVRVEEQLGMFMFMLSHNANASYEDLQYEFKHSGETIHRHIKSVFGIISALTYRFLKPALATETHWKISTDTLFFPYFKVNKSSTKDQPISPKVYNSRSHLF